MLTWLKVVPPRHSAFSSLAFAQSATASTGVAIDEKENLDDDSGVCGEDDYQATQRRNEEDRTDDNEGGYLSGDDIEDF